MAATHKGFNGPEGKNRENGQNANVYQTIRTAGDPSPARPDEIAMAREDGECPRCDFILADNRCDKCGFNF